MNYVALSAAENMIAVRQDYAFCTNRTGTDAGTPRSPGGYSFGVLSIILLAYFFTPPL